jgi:hypothetical protein
MSYPRMSWYGGQAQCFCFVGPRRTYHVIGPTGYDTYAAKMGRVLNWRGWRFVVYDRKTR